MNLNPSLPPSRPPGLLKPPAALAKKVSKESAIGKAFRSEIKEDCLNLSARGIGDQQINEINKNL